MVNRYGLLNYRSGLQKVANICRADSNITIVAHYKFDEASGNLVDYSGNSHTLTASGSPTYQQADYLSLNRAITFTPGTSDYFSKADHADFDLNGSEILTDGALEVWTGDVPDNWVKVVGGTSTIEDDAVVFHGGAHSPKFTIDAGNSLASLSQIKTLEANTLYTVEFWYKTEANKTCQASLRNVTSSKYLNSSGVWTATSSIFTPATGFFSTSWKKYVFNFVSDTAGTYQLTVARQLAASSVFNIDDISLTKAYDCVIWVIAKVTNVAQIDYLITKYNAANYYYCRIDQTTGKIAAALHDGVDTISKTGNTNVNDGAHHLIEFKFNRDSSTGLDIFLDGSSDLSTKGDLTSIGTLGNASTFTLGGLNPNFLAGSIAEVVVIKGSPLPNWVMSATFAANAYNWSMKWPLNTRRKIG